MPKMFSFDPTAYAETFLERGYAHISPGLRPEFLANLLRYVDDSFDEKHLKDFARGDKQQAMYEFLEAEHYDELRDVVGALCGVEPSSLTLSERHIKQYEAGANPHPLAHKDRFGSEFSVGFSIRVPQGSTLVIYPQDELGANPFNSTAELRSSFSPETVPEPRLKTARRLEIQDRPGDVQVFRGSAMWHLREHGAETTVLYLKLNTYNCDTLGEDPHTDETREQTLSTLNMGVAWTSTVPVLGRRVDYIHRRYSRDWKELFGVVLSGQPHTTISEMEFDILRAMDGQLTAKDVSSQFGLSSGAAAEAIRRLAQRGIVDLLTTPISMGRSVSELVAQAA